MKRMLMKRYRPILFAVGFAVIGLVTLGASRAAVSTANIEPESGTKSSQISTVSDSSASGSSAVRFTAPPVAGACPNDQHMPGGPDGMGGCWPYEGNTGVPAGTTLTTYTGSCSITTPNTVIDSKMVNCGLNIRAANVVIRNSQINGNIYVDSCTGNYSVTIEDSRVHVGDINYRGLQPCYYVARRVNVTGGQSMAWCANCTIEDSFLHAPLEDPEGAANNHAAHNSTVRIAAYATLRHNTLWCNVKSYPQPDGQDDSGCSANQTGYSHDGSPPHYSTIEANLYMPTSGGYCAYGGSTSGELDQVHHIVFKDNIFRRTAPGWEGGPNCGYWGAIADFDSSRPGNQWINNRWSDGTTLPPSD